MSVASLRPWQSAVLVRCLRTCRRLPMPAIEHGVTLAGMRVRDGGAAGRFRLSDELELLFSTDATRLLIALLDEGGYAIWARHLASLRVVGDQELSDDASTDRRVVADALSATIDALEAADETPAYPVDGRPSQRLSAHEMYAAAFTARSASSDVAPPDAGAPGHSGSAA